jgi:hypothetical protein
MKPKKEPAFIPGFEASFNRNLRAEGDLQRSNLQLLPDMKWDSADDSRKSDMLSPIESGQWGWLPFQRVEFPFVPEAGLLHFILMFDCDPGNARYRVEYRSSDGESWNLVSEGSNYYGGLYERQVDIVLPRRLLTSTKNLQLRIGMMYRRPASYPTESPPIALFVLSSESFPNALSIHLWDSLYIKSDSGGAL